MAGARSIARYTGHPLGGPDRGATPEGVLDLAGNVLEWCRDWYGPYPEGEELDYGGPKNGDRRVLRGGSFGYEAHSLRAACRFDVVPVGRIADVGFRLVSSFPGGQG